MQPKSRHAEQDDLLRPRVVELIAMRHELVKPGTLIRREFFGRERAGFFPSSTGRPATSPRGVARWVENPYHQHFCGFTVRRSPSPNLSRR